MALRALAIPLGQDCRSFRVPFQLLRLRVDARIGGYIKFSSAKNLDADPFEPPRAGYDCRFPAVGKLWRVQPHPENQHTLLGDRGDLRNILFLSLSSHTFSCLHTSSSCILTTPATLEAQPAETADIASKFARQECGVGSRSGKEYRRSAQSTATLHRFSEAGPSRSDLSRELNATGLSKYWEEKGERKTFRSVNAGVEFSCRLCASS